MLIVGLTKTTLLDYPGRVAASVFVGGCNFRCPFCHNAGIVLEPLSQNKYTEDEILTFLEKRKKILKGVCITGGEPTCHDDLPEFIRKVKTLGYQVKLDTNGYKPEMLKILLQEKLLDYVAMDIKNCPEKYPLTVGYYPNAELFAEGEENGDKRYSLGGFHMEKVEESVAVLKKSDIPYEFRTTLVKEFHTREDLLKISDWIKGCPFYFLQQYQENENVIFSTTGGRLGQTEGGSGNSGQFFHSFGREEMEDMAEAIRHVMGMTGEVRLRG